MSTTPQKWYNVYRNDDEKCVFVGKDGASGLIRATDKNTGRKYEWRTTDSLARESGLSKRRVEEILEYYCNKKIVRQNAKDPEKWGYWELVGSEKDDPDVVAKDHEKRMDKQSGKINPSIAKPIPSPTQSPPAQVNPLFNPAFIPPSGKPKKAKVTP